MRHPGVPDRWCRDLLSCAWNPLAESTGLLLVYHLVAVNCRYSHSCLALFYLRQALEHHVPGCRIRLSQYTLNDPYYRTLLELTGSETDALFFSVYIWNHAYVRRLVSDLATVRPDLPLILGGPQAPELSGLPAKATVVQGEIEGIGESFYDDLVSGKLRPVYRAEGRPSFSSPYRKQDFDTALHNRQVYYESSRGCPFSCAYCLSSITRGVRHLDMGQVRRELALILEAEPKIVKFVDRTFNTDLQRTLELWRYLAGLSTCTRFHFEVAPDRFPPWLLDFLQTVPAGRFQFEVGLQSFTPEALQAVDRQMDPEAAAEHVRYLVSLDTIHIHADLILGLPFETAASFRSSFNRLFALAPHHLQLGLLKILPGTRLAGRCREFGLIHCDQPPYEILATRWLDHGTLRYLYGFCNCVELFHNNRFFPSFWRYLRNTGEEPFAFFTSLLDLAQAERFFSQAPTHALLNRLLVKIVQSRSDRDLVLDLLRFDWLRCGYRFLPPELDGPELNKVRRRLRLQLPQNMAGLYSYTDREEFFKQTIFLPLGGAAVKELRLGDGRQDGIVCLLPAMTAGVRSYRQAVLLAV